MQSCECLADSTHGYHKPFALTFANTASFVTYLAPFAALYTLRGRRGRSRTSRHNKTPWYEHLGFRLPPQDAGEPLVLDVERVGRDRIRHIRPSSIDGRRPESNLVAPKKLHPSLPRSASPESYGSIESEVLASDLPPLSVRETAVLACQFAILWFAANWSFIAALGFTSVASGTTLGSASGFFTLLLGSVVGTDRFSRGKLIAVTLSFLGVALVTWADAGMNLSVESFSRAILGDLLALLSALCASLANPVMHSM